jgi:uncharacterized protein YndB with AHSA1/START domain
MRWLGRLIAVVVAIGVLVVAAAYLLPREVTVTREIVIEAPPERVFPHLNSLQRAAEWSPWIDMDPTMKRTFAGPRQGVGNRMTWTSSNPRFGNGHQKIVASVRNRRVETAIDYGAVIATSWQDLIPTDGGTRVTWGLFADVGGAPTRRYLGLLLARRIGADHAEGLLRLKALIEAE